MEKEYPNKAMNPTDVKTKGAELTPYFFPPDLTINATSLEEATKKYEEIQKQNNKK